MGCEVLIVGGGVMGAALAYFLRQRDPTVGVTVIERDPTYREASSALSAASIRQQYTTPLNIAIAKRSLAILREVPERLSVDEEVIDLGFIEAGYLYLANATQAPGLERASRIQQAAGADVARLDAAALAARYPWMRVDDLALGTLGCSGEGWFDGWALLQAFVRKARDLGAVFVRAEAVALEREGARIAAVRLADGTRLTADVVVDAAGPWARSIAATAGVDLPVRARRRTVFVIETPNPLPLHPLLIDPSGFWLRPEGRRHIGGVVPLDDADDLPLEPAWGEWEDVLWPALAHRIPAFEAARVERAWAGYYEMNTFDHNAIVGPHPEVDNLHFLCGFSGHGLQQAPAVAEALAGYLLTGRYETLDLSALGFARIAAGMPLVEANIIG